VFFRLIDGQESYKKSQLLKSQHRFDQIGQDDFDKIPGSPIAYWLSKAARSCFGKEKISDNFVSDGAVKTGNNDKYIRQIWEVDASHIST